MANHIAASTEYCGRQLANTFRTTFCAQWEHCGNYYHYISCLKNWKMWSGPFQTETQSNRITDVKIASKVKGRERNGQNSDYYRPLRITVDN